MTRLFRLLFTQVRATALTGVLLGCSRLEPAFELDVGSAGAQLVGVVEAERERERMVLLIGDGAGVRHDAESHVAHGGGLVGGRCPPST
jgi:hypothetical protein